MTTVFIIERTLGNSFTTFNGVDGEQHRVSIGNTRIGPFTSVAAAADYLSAHAAASASYLLEYERPPT